MSIVSSLSHGAGWLRLMAGLPAFVRESCTLEDARAYVRARMAAREAIFLEKLDRSIFGHARSPYLALFQAAGCERGDVERLMGEQGVEGTLAELRRAGIYVTFGEFKGLEPAIRGSRTFAFRDTDFDNPLIRPHYFARSGGTRGTPTRIRLDLDFIGQSAHHWALWFAANDWLHRPLLFWWPYCTNIVTTQLRCARFGTTFSKWFYMVGPGTLGDRLATATLHALVRRVTGFPAPEFVPLSEAARVADCLVKMLEEGARPCLRTSPSAAARVSLAVLERGASLRGATFLLGAEPVTPARKKTIEDSGAEAVVTYGFSEGGTVGHQCPNPTTPDDVHILRDAYAVVAAPRAVGDESVNALYLTALLPACPKVLLNTEIGDEAVIERRPCGCLFDDIGYHDHLHTIRSFEKLTGEGVTFVGSDLFHVLEDVLPRRFGGGLADYQLLEEQDARGLPRYTLRVSPEVGELDERVVLQVFLTELGRLRNHYRGMTTLWEQAGSLRVERRPPLATRRGKLFPFRTLAAPLTGQKNT
jgi:hypothetical protein